MSSMDKYSQLLVEVQTQNQAIELLSEIVQSFHNTETEMDAQIEKVIDLVGGYKALHLIIPYLDSTQHGFKEKFTSLSDLSTLLEIAEGAPDDNIEFDREAMIPDLSMAKSNFKRRVLDLIATYKKADKQVLMNIPRKVIAAMKHSKKSNNSTGGVADI